MAENQFLVAVATKDHTALSDEWQARLCASGGIDCLIGLAERSDLNAASLAFLKSQTSVKIRAALIRSHSHDVELMNELVTHEKRLTILTELACVPGLRAEVVETLVNRATNPLLAVTVAVRDDVSTQHRAQLCSVIAEQTSVKTLAGPTFSEKLLGLCNKHDDVFPQIVLALNDLPSVTRFLGWNADRNRGITLAVAMHALTVINKHRAQNGPLFDLNTVDDTRAVSNFLHSVGQFLRIPGLTGENLSEIRDTLSELAATLKEKCRTNAVRSWNMQKLFERAEAELEFVSDKSYLSLYRGVSATTETDLRVVLKELGVIPQTPSGQALHDRFCRLILANPAANFEVLAEALSKLSWTKRHDLESTAKYIPFTDERATKLTRSVSLSNETLIWVICNSESPNLVLQDAFSDTGRSNRASFHLGIVFTLAFTQGVGSDVLETLACSASVGDLRRLKVDPQQLFQAEATSRLLHIIDEKVISALGNSEDAWHTFLTMTANQANTPVVDIAALSAKLAAHTPS